MSNIRKRAIWSMFPDTVRAMRRAVMFRHGIPEERYPVAMRRVLYLANRDALAQHLARRNR